MIGKWIDTLQSQFEVPPKEIKRLRSRDQNPAQKHADKEEVAFLMPRKQQEIRRRNQSRMADNLRLGEPPH